MNLEGWFFDAPVVVDFLATELHRLAVEARTGDKQRERLEKGRPRAAKMCICLLSSCCAHVGLTFHQTSLQNRICFQEMRPDAADETMDRSFQFGWDTQRTTPQGWQVRDEHRRC